MAGNIITITFNEDLKEGSVLGLIGQYSNGINTVSLNPAWTWDTLRNAPYKVTKGTPTDTIGERTAINFVAAFNLDMNGTGQHQVSRALNVVTIISNYGNVSGYTWESGYAFGPGPSGADVVFSFAFNNNNTPFLIESIEYLVPDDTAKKCTHVKVRVTTNINIKNVYSPVTATNVNAAVFNFEYLRGTTGNIILESTQAQPITITQAFETPASIAPENHTINVNNSPNGATIIISNTNQNGLIFKYIFVLPGDVPTDDEYSDGYLFTGLLPGNFWLYIKDQFGCVKYKPFTISEFGAGQAPYFYISKSNSIRFANRITFGDAANYKNDENTLSCEVNVPLPYMEVQQFQTADIITTQFKSNYAVNTATVINEDIGAETDIPVLKKSNYMGVKDSRDAIKVDLGNNKTGIYFESGQTYDYDTGVPTGNYALNGALPYWATFGTSFMIDNAWFQVSEIYYDDVYGADIIVLEVPYGGAPVSIIVSTIYNIFNYEIYEFTIDMVNFINEDIRVRIDNEDSLFTDLQHLSEVISVKVRHAGTLDISYKNLTNNDVYYATGISHRIRQLFTKVGGLVDGESEMQRTDTTTRLSKVDLYESDEFTFEPVTKEIMRKIVMALSHEIVSIDSVQYVMNSLPEVEGPLEQSNLYVVKAKMTKTGGVYSNENGAYGFNESSTEIPALVEYEGGFIRY